MTDGFQLLELIADPIAHASLQQIGDILIQLAVLPPQGGNRDDHGGLDVPQLKDDLVQGRCASRRPPAKPTIPLLRPRAHHVGDVTLYLYE
jgi:hypothetical protein